MACPPIDSPTTAMFTTLFPAFVAVDAAVLSYWMGAAKAELCHPALCERWERAVYLYMAHFMTITGVVDAAATPGALPAGVFVRKHQDGDVSTEFDTTAAAQSASASADATLPYSGSQFGIMLSGLLKKRGVHVMNTGGCYV